MLALALATRAVAASPRVIAVDVDGMVHPITAEIVNAALLLAKVENASPALIRFITPGGLMDDMRSTIEKIVASPVLTYVSPSEYPRTLRQKIISAIADPNIALVLLVIGALGIYVEFCSPGLIVPGVLGAILVLLALSAITVLPINWRGVALMILAFGLFVLEVKWTSHGVLGAGGALAMVLGAVMLIDSPVPELRVHWSTAIGLALPFSAITVFLLTIAARARRNKLETAASKASKS